jgi:hypothetical protein
LGDAVEAGVIAEANSAAEAGAVPEPDTGNFESELVFFVPFTNTSTCLE